MISIELEIKTLWVTRSQSDHEKWLNLITSAGLREELHLDEVIGLFDGNRLVATGAIQDNIMKCLVVCQSYTGGEVMNQLMTELINRLYQKGYRKFFIYTKPSAALSFQYVGFKELIRTEEVVFLEKAVGEDSFQNYLASLVSKKVNGKHVGSIVMNANPFTKGHRYLVERALEICDVLHIFVVSQERSVFPTVVRRKLVMEGVQDLDNVWVHDTQDYIVSSATFPAYFLNEDQQVTQVQAEVDSTLFMERIAPVLGIQHRFVGEEPYSPTTAVYNQTMTEVFQGKIRLHVIPRCSVMGNTNDYISASKARQYLSEGRWEDVSRCVPKTTYQFLRSDKGMGIVHSLQRGIR